MQVQVNTGNGIEGSSELTEYIDSLLKDSFQRYGASLTRIEVYLADENAEKSGDADKRCLLEARLSHRQPLVTSHNADNIHQAIDGAVERLQRLLDETIDKMQEHTRAKDLWQNTYPSENLNIH